MKKILIFFLIFLLAFANTDEWIIMEEPASFMYTQDKNAVKKRFLERAVEKENAAVIARGKVHTSTPAVRKNRVRIYFYFLFMCFLYVQSKKSRKGDIFTEIRNFLEYHIRRMRQIHQMDGKKRSFSPTFVNV